MQKNNSRLLRNTYKKRMLELRSTEDKVYIDVFDRGKGILEDSKDRVFERLYTMEDSRNKRYQGSGIGLTITKRLVEQNG